MGILPGRRESIRLKQRNESRASLVLIAPNISESADKYLQLAESRASPANVAKRNQVAWRGGGRDLLAELAGNEGREPAEQGSQRPVCGLAGGRRSRCLARGGHLLRKQAPARLDDAVSARRRLMGQMLPAATAACIRRLAESLIAATRRRGGNRLREARRFRRGLSHHSPQS